MKLPPAIVYVVAPLGVIVKLFPWQMLPLLTEIVGVVWTVTWTTDEAVHPPSVFVPTTLNPVDEAGVNWAKFPTTEEFQV